MSSRQGFSDRKIQYPFIVRPVPEGWEVLFTATDRPYREAFFEAHKDALDFAEVNNDNWAITTRIWYELLNRIRDKIDLQNQRARKNIFREMGAWARSLLG